MTGKLVAGVLLSICLTQPAVAGELDLTIAGVHSSKGAVMIGIYDSAARFDLAIEESAKVGKITNKNRLIGVTMRARKGDQGIGFKLPPGRYGIIVFHDENDNGKLDKSLVGLPTEGYGFSNNAMGFLSAPSFDEAAVSVGASRKQITITLDYQEVTSLLPKHG